MVEVRRMDECDRDIRDEVTGVILDGFFSQLSFFTKDRRKLSTAFRDEVRADMFYVAELDGEIVGVLACSDNSGRALVANKVSLRRGLGYVMGTIAARVLAREFNSALPYDDDTGYVEWVATSEHARGKGVSTALFQHVMQHLRYQTLVLEVVDVNDKERIYMRWSKDAARTLPGTSVV